MKIKQPILAVLFSLSTIASAFSQEPVTSKNVKITHSEGYEVVDAYSKQYFKIEDGILAIKIIGKKQNEFIFQKFTGSRLNETSRVTKVLDGAEFNVLYYKPIGFYEIGKKLQYIYSIYDKTNVKEQLFALEVNIDKGGFAAKPKLLLAVNEKLAGSRYSQFSIDLSENKEKMIVRYNYISDIKNNAQSKAKIGMSVFGPELELMWENDVTMPGTENLISVEDFTVDSNGNGFFLLLLFRSS